MTPPASSPSPNALGLALIAAVLASVGDFGMLYAGQQAGNPALGWPAPPPFTLALGQWLGAFMIPLFGVGYASLAQGLAGRARPIVYWLGIYTSALGGVIHAVTGLAILHTPIEAGGNAGAFAIDPTSLPFLMPFVVVVVLGLLIASGVFAHAVFSGTSVYPRWLGFMNPVSCVVLVSCAGMPFEYGWLFLVPMAPNVGSVGFFALTLAVARRA